ncbi:unnamed protein product [Dicrocoelium dendriticum]|nr:unnamed protein product [Dicrocoelium dendriticum]
MITVIIRQMHQRTSIHSEIGKAILRDWSTAIRNFIFVFPPEYRYALEAEKHTQPNGTGTCNSSMLKPEKTNKRMQSVPDIEDMADGDSEDHTTSKLPLDKLRGFVRYARSTVLYRPIDERMNDWEELFAHREIRSGLKRQAARCMDCGVPFCQSHTGCPLGNFIPNWIDLVFKDDWYAAYQALLQTNNFPEFTGRVCPAPCEGACVLGINSDPVTIQNVECAIADKAWEQGWFRPTKTFHRPTTGRRIVVVGSGPAGLACADQLNLAGHNVVVVERRNKPGGHLRYGIPTMKLNRAVLDRRIDLMKSNGVLFVVNTRVGPADNNDFSRPEINASCAELVEEWPAHRLLQDFDAVVLCLGATWPRDLPIPGELLWEFFAFTEIYVSNQCS